eukprot:COSAG05_NODE_227_length_13407_cov_32.277953_5_plen_57_part_00
MAPFGLIICAQMCGARAERRAEVSALRDEMAGLSNELKDMLAEQVRATAATKYPTY